MKNGMDINLFLESYEPKLTEYCAVTIDEKGIVYDSTEGHLQTLIEMQPDPQILSNIPKDKTPLFYLIKQLGAVIVDYENQLYYKSLTEEQKSSLSKLAKRELIKEHYSNIEHLI